MPLPRLEFENAVSVPVECNNLNNNFLKGKQSVVFRQGVDTRRGQEHQFTSVRMTKFLYWEDGSVG